MSEPFSTPVSLLQRIREAPTGEAWERFVDLYSPLLFRWAQRLNLSEHDAADLVQEVFAALVDHLPRFCYDPGRSFRAWLKTILLNAWRKYATRKAAHLPMGDVPLDTVSDTDPRMEIEEEEYRRQLVARALALMQAEFEPSTWKACWEFVVSDRPASEVAADLGITVNAVYLAKSRVLRRLRVVLQGMLD